MTELVQIQHQERKHALCSASKSNIWLNCPAALTTWLQAPPRPSNKYAIEGTKAHELAEKLLKARLKEETYEMQNDDMFLNVQKYVLYVLHKYNEFDEPPQVKIEASLILDKELDMYGLADIAMTGYKKGIQCGIIIDLKYGKTPVSAEENSQLAYYAVALMTTSKKALESVEVCIHQPRIKNPVTSVVYSSLELIEWKKTLTDAANKSYLQHIGLQEKKWVKGDHCKWCEGKVLCPEWETGVREYDENEFC